MTYNGIILKEEIKVTRLFSLHYFEYMSSFHFSEGSHTCWEFIYMDKGEAEIYRDGKSFSLKKDEAVFYAPGDPCEFRIKEKSSPNLMTLSFTCASSAMEYFRGQTFRLNEKERAILGLLLFEARTCFSSNLGDPHQNELRCDLSAGQIPFGTQQLIRLYLEQFLLLLQRRYRIQESTLDHISLPTPSYPGKLVKKNSDREIYERIVNYMLAHIDSSLTIEQICHDNLIGRSQLQKLFHEQNCCGIIHFFSTLKIDAAKQYIRDGQMNFTQISETLGFSTIHYFSRQFKRIAGMTPSEYASSVKRISEQR